MRDLIFFILDYLGCKKIILDRGPFHHNFLKAKPWIARYYILMERKPRWFPFNIFINRMITDDHRRGVHNHPDPYLTIILRGVVAGRPLMPERFREKLGILVAG